MDIATVVLGVALLLALAYFSFVAWSYVFGAPWVPTRRAVLDAMLTMARVGPNDTVYDLGCGDGRVLIAAARTYGARAVGIEVDPLRYLWTQGAIALLGLRGRVEVRYGDFFRHDLRPADVVICYLVQRTNDRLQRKLERELRPGTRVVSNTYVFADWTPVRFDAETNLYLYRTTDDR